MNRSLIACALPIFLSATMPPSLDAGQLRVVALTGTLPPGGTAPFVSFGAISINNAGQVAFNPWRLGNQVFNSSGVWINTPGQGSVLVDAPQYGHWNLTLNNNGQAAFTKGGALVRGSSMADAQNIAAGNLPAPGVGPPDSPFTNAFNYSSVAFNDQNNVAFVGTAGGRDRLYVGNSYDSLQLIVSAGQVVDDRGQNRAITGLGGVQLNEAGDLLFGARFQDPVTGANYHVVQYLWTQDHGVARIGGWGDTLSTDRGAFQIPAEGFPAQINSQGELALIVDYTLLVSSPQGYKVVAAENDSIGDERIFYLTRRYAMTGSDTVVYEAAMIGGTAIPNQTYLILKGRPGEQPTAVARSRTQAPDAAAGLVFPSSFNCFETNVHSQVAFSSRLVDIGTGEFKGSGVWAEDGNGVLRSIAQTGDFIDVDMGPGIDLRQVSLVNDISLGSNQSGLPSQFNDLGQVAFVAIFTDGSQAIVVSAATVPEPALWTLMLACIAGGFGRRLRL